MSYMGGVSYKICSCAIVCISSSIHGVEGDEFKRLEIASKLPTKFNLVYQILPIIVFQPSCSYANLTLKTFFSFLLVLILLLICICAFLLAKNPKIVQIREWSSYV